MSRTLIRRHAAAGLYAVSVAAALLSAASLVAYAQEPEAIELCAARLSVNYPGEAR
jgi:hypothetical protein